MPLVILTVMSVVAGWLNGFGLHAFAKWTANATVAPGHRRGPCDRGQVLLPGRHHLGRARPGRGRARCGSSTSSTPSRRCTGSPSGRRPAQAGYSFLENKYYLDALYTDRIVGGIKGPIARATYWVNQNVIDGVVNGVASAARYVAEFVYDVIDQEIVDGAVNGAGVTAEGGGGFLRTFQTGRVQQYAAAFFGLGVVAIGVGLLLLTHAFS